MILISDLTDKLIEDALELLYKDEFMNLHLIHYFENQKDDIGELYFEYSDELLVGIMSVRFDGNTNFISFYYTSYTALEAIARSIDDLECKKKLVAGSLLDVQGILSILNITNELTEFSYYKYHADWHMRSEVNAEIDLVRVRELGECEILRKYLIDFFGAETIDDIEPITSTQKLKVLIRSGIYILYVGTLPVGMARFHGFSDKFIEITTVYVEPNHRAKGYGKVLLELMIGEALKLNKTPVLQADKANVSAIRLYEGMGFTSVEDYTFKLI